MLTIPSNPQELQTKAKADLQAYLPTNANPFLQESWMGAQAVANANRVFDFYQQLKILSQECIPITAEEYLEMWASYWGIVRNPATTATGIVVATGTAGTLINQGTVLSSTDGQTYTVNQDVTISLNTVNITLTSVGTTATATLASAQSIYTGLSVTIAGATQTAYNGTFTITVTSNTVFTYTMTTSAASPATGSPQASFTTAAVSVTSDGFGQDQNQSANARLTFATPIVGANTQAYVDQNSIGGGTDIETNTELRARLLDRVQNPVAHFNVAEITYQAKLVSGVTDVFVYEITPALGQVTIYFIRGNDDNPIPDGSEITAVKNKILEIKPANTASADVIVLAPTPITANFTFTALSPNTASMQNAITAQLRAMFLDSAIVGEPLTENQYIAAIQTTIDPQTGSRVQSFTLSSPSGDIGGGTGEYPVLGAVTFP
jgi:uncharacterized phage protein gp47/JayE